VSTSGKITWDIPEDTDTPAQQVVVRVSDSSKQQTLHSFIIDLPEVRKRLSDSKQVETAVAGMKAKMAKKTFEFRQWRAASGNHSVDAKFVKLEDQSIVVLKSKDGKEIKLRLSKLAKEDIYIAVKSDLELRNLWEPSPFATSGERDW